MQNENLLSLPFASPLKLDEKEQAMEDLEGLQTMRTLGENMAWLLKCIEAGRAAGVREPEYEAPIRTNFIR